MQMYVSGQWTESPNMVPIKAPYSGETVDTVPAATPEQIDQALDAAVAGAAAMRAITAYERTQILNRAADLIADNAEDLARTITLEEGKPIGESRVEVSRMPDLLRLCAFEGAQIRGEILPLDAHVGTQGKFGYTMKVPCGVVVAITPFNFPLLLVVHKVGPALAAGNAVILKPARQTPLSALKLTKLLIEAGLPENGLQCVTGSGSQIGPLLCSDPRVRKVTFTGSAEVGESITNVAGVKKISLELGSNSPLIVLPDADLQQVTDATVIGGYVNAGQVCISLQRILVHRDVYGDFIDNLKAPVEAIKVGDPLLDDTQLSAMISVGDAERVGAWIDEAVEGGAKVVTGGEREGAMFAPTIVADVNPGMRVSCDELFGPAVAVTPVDSVDEAITLSNDSIYGLSAALFTRDMNSAFRFAHQAESGNVMINWSPLWRADFMPYGGFKQSGIGKEGPRYAIEEMTETKTVVFHGINTD